MTLLSILEYSENSMQPRLAVSMKDWIHNKIQVEFQYARVG
jgi:hypothetical protein